MSGGSQPLSFTPSFGETPWFNDQEETPRAIGWEHSDIVLSYSAESAVIISAVRGQKPNRTNDSTNFPYSGFQLGVDTTS